MNLVAQLGIDLGTANILVYKRGSGIVLTEPTVVAIDTRVKKVLAIGNEAREMLGRTPSYIRASRPLKDGVISEYTVTYQMLDHIRTKVLGSHQLIKPHALICVPSGITDVEQRAVIKAAQAARFGLVETIEEPMAAAIGCGLPIETAAGSMVVDIGGGTTDIAVISLGGPVLSASIRVAGAKMDEAIIKHVKNTHNLMIGEQTAEEVKIRIGSAYPLEEELKMPIRGRDLAAGLPKTVEITSDEIREALSEPVRMIAEKLCSVLEETPPELSSDIIERGITLTGGGAMLRGLDTLLSKVTEIPVTVADNALHSVALGTGMALSHLRTIKKHTGAVKWV